MAVGRVETSATVTESCDAVAWHGHSDAAGNIRMGPVRSGLSSIVVSLPSRDCKSKRYCDESTL